MWWDGDKTGPGETETVGEERHRKTSAEKGSLSCFHGLHVLIVLQIRDFDISGEVFFNPVALRTAKTS